MKPREFWIFKQNDFDLGFESSMVAEYPHRDSLDGSEIHVIEYSAYKKLEERHKKLVEALRETAIASADGRFCDAEDIACDAIEADKK